MTSINLGKKWRLGDKIASGGFASVFAALDESAVIKLIPKEPGASRELLFEELTGATNVLPTLDSGEWEGNYVLVMPRADMSLRQYIDAAGGKLAVEEAIAVLVDVAAAIASLAGGVVHRDLKPENVLLYEKRWHIADFGIARYADATTAPDTHKYAMTPAYAAPEQWRAERASSATDVYAFGVMAFELLEGKLPLPGPSVPDFREQHLEVKPPSLGDCPPALSSLVSECLYKRPEARPNPANILARLETALAESSPATAKLQTVNKAITEGRAEDAAKESALRSRAEERDALFSIAEESLNRVLDRLRRQVLEAAPAADETGGPGLTLRLGDGVLAVDPLSRAPLDCLAAYDYEAPFDVVAYTAIVARKPRDRYDYEGRSHSLWFCDAHDEGLYRWYELAYMVQPVIPERYTLAPFALSPTDEEAANALTPVMTVRQVAWSPTPFDQGEEDQFIERWIEWLASAADGTLSHPSSMPEKSGGKWRFSQKKRA